jgi:CRISPR-associated protein Csx3
VNSLPAILIGGPPHSGKSVLFYSLTIALRKQNITHHAIRACPDGEGNWSQEIDQAMVRQLRIKGQWTDAFTEGICRDIKQRLVPMLIDMGGLPQASQLNIFHHCTHSLLLLNSDDEQGARNWCKLVAENGLLPLAQLRSELYGTSVITAESPVIRGTLAGLERSTLVHGPAFDVLLERVASLFSTYSPQDLEKALLDRAPTETVIHLPILLQTLSPGSHRWEPAMLPSLLASLPTDTAIAVYGQGPHWLYGALAAFAGPRAFYQFDPRGIGSAGWISPPTLRFGTISSDELLIQPCSYEQEQATILKIEIVGKHLDYLQTDLLPFPAISTTHGLIFDGIMPSWLLTALVRLYRNAGVPWIACHYPPLKAAIVVTASSDMHCLGDLIPMPVE